MKNVHLLFPVPVYTNILELDNQCISDILETVTWKRDTDSYGNPNGHTSFSDKNDLLSDPRLTFLSDRIDVEVKTFIHNFIKVSGDRHHFERTSSWGTRTLKGDYTHEHSHTNSHFSGVYYVKVPPKSGEVLNFSGYRTNPTFCTGSTMFDLDELNQVNQPISSIKVTEGMLVVFPSHIYHHVPVSTSFEVRYSISFNYFGFGEFGDSTNYLRIKHA